MTRLFQRFGHDKRDRFAEIAHAVSFEQGVRLREAAGVLRHPVRALARRVAMGDDCDHSLRLLRRLDVETDDSARRGRGFDDVTFGGSAIPPVVGSVAGLSRHLRQSVDTVHRRTDD